MSTNRKVDASFGNSKTNGEILKELKREMAMRARIYPRWVREGRMTEADRAHRVACLQGAIDHFAGLARGGTQKDLLDG